MLGRKAPSIDDRDRARKKRQCADCIVDTSHYCFSIEWFLEGQLLFWCRLSFDVVFNKLLESPGDDSCVPISLLFTSRLDRNLWLVLMALVVRQSQSFMTKKTILVLLFPVVLQKNSRLLEQTFFVVVLSGFLAYAMFIRHLR